MRIDEASAPRVDVRAQATPRYARARVRHEDIRGLLPLYAAAALDEARASEVRAHLATGCPGCLAEVFRDGPSARPAPSSAPLGVAASAGGASTRAGKRSRLPLVALGVLALVATAAAGWTLDRLRRRDAAYREATAQSAARVAELEQSRAALEERVRAAEAARAAAAAETRALQEHLQADAAASAELSRRLAEAEARAAALARRARRREADLARLLASDEARALGELAATPGVQLLRLVPRPGMPGVRGHVLWHPARQQLVLYAFDLPDGRYRVRLRLAGDVAAAGPPLRLRAGGEVTAAVELGVRGALVRSIEVVREPDDARVLEGRLPGAGVTG